LAGLLRVLVQGRLEAADHRGMDRYVVALLASVLIGMAVLIAAALSIAPS